MLAERRIPGRKTLIITGLMIGLLIILPICLIGQNIPAGMFGSILLGMPIAMTLERGFGYDVDFLHRKDRKLKGWSYLLMGLGAVLILFGISRLLMGSM